MKNLNQGQPESISPAERYNQYQWKQNAINQKFNNYKNFMSTVEAMKAALREFGE